MNFTQYMRTLAEKSTYIQHSESDKRFYRMSGLKSFEEVLTNLLRAKTPAVAVDDSLEGKLYYNNFDNLLNRQYFSFFVLGKASLLNHDQREETLQQLKDISLAFSLKIIADSKTDFAQKTNFGLRLVDPSSFSYRTINNLPEGIIAIAVSFVLDSPLNAVIDQNVWQ